MPSFQCFNPAIAMVFAPPRDPAMQMAKLERKLLEEEEGRKNDVARAEARVRSLEGELAAEHKRRLSEQLRALVQGAPFIFHKAHSAEQRTIWYR